MLKREIAQIPFDVISPSVYAVHNYPTISIEFDGLLWNLNDWNEASRHASLDMAADYLAGKLRMAALDRHR